MTSQLPPAITCTLTTDRRIDQQLEWSDLAKHATTCVPIGGGVESEFPLELADQIEDLTERELACCGSWLTIVFHRAVETCRLQLTTTNPEGVDLIRSMSGL